MHTNRRRSSALLIGICLVILGVAPAAADDRARLRVFERQVETQRAVIAAQREIISNLQRKLSWQARHPHAAFVTAARVPRAAPPAERAAAPAAAAATTAATTAATPQVVSRTVHETLVAPPAVSLPSYGWGRI